MIVKRSGSYGVSVYDKTVKRKRWVGTYPTFVKLSRLSMMRLTRSPFVDLRRVGTSRGGGLPTIRGRLRRREERIAMRFSDSERTSRVYRCAIWTSRLRVAGR
jgi:hypothetical protein